MVPLKLTSYTLKVVRLVVAVAAVQDMNFSNVISIVNGALLNACKGIDFNMLPLNNPINGRLHSRTSSVLTVVVDEATTPPARVRDAPVYALPKT